MHTTQRLDFLAIFEQMNRNQMKKEERMSRENEDKLDYYHRRDETKRLDQQQRSELLKQKSKERI